jgi:hypothetical protein
MPKTSSSSSENGLKLEFKFQTKDGKFIITKVVDNINYQAEQ